MGIIIKTDHLSAEHETKLFEMLEKHNGKVEIKKGGLKIPIKHQIHLKDENPLCLPPRRIPYRERDEIGGQIENVLHDGIITPSISPYSASIVTVKKTGQYSSCTVNDLISA